MPPSGSCRSLLIMSHPGANAHSVELSVLDQSGAATNQTETSSLQAFCEAIFPHQALKRDARLVQDFWTASQRIGTSSDSDLTSWRGTFTAASKHVGRSVMSLVTRTEKEEPPILESWPEPTTTLHALKKLHDLNAAFAASEEVTLKYGPGLDPRELARKLESEATKDDASQLGQEVVRCIDAAFQAEEKVLKLCRSPIAVVVALHRWREGDEFCQMDCCLNRQKEAITRQYRALSSICRQTGFLMWAASELSGGKSRTAPIILKCQAAISAVVKAVGEDEERLFRLADVIRTSGIPQMSDFLNP